MASAVKCLALPIPISLPSILPMMRPAITMAQPSKEAMKTDNAPVDEETLPIGSAKPEYFADRKPLK
ncbi:hypothetical protein [Sphingomonas oleivorans]|uniref:hypothetical protein n=1 Tax=Sphingomonas oleivorans TaxID=1735121 RepID=UPI0013FD20C7|nr:hypothetical protein [Sphingomonas oleivorans]